MPEKKPTDTKQEVAETQLVQPGEHSANYELALTDSSVAQGTTEPGSSANTGSEVSTPASSPKSLLPKLEAPKASEPINTKDTNNGAPKTTKPDRRISTLVMMALIVFGFKRLEYGLPWADHQLVSIAVGFALQVLVWTQWDRIKRWLKLTGESTNPFLMVLFILGFFGTVLLLFLALKLLIPLISPAPDAAFTATLWLDNLLVAGYIALLLRWYLGTLPDATRARLMKPFKKMGIDDRK